MTAAQLQQWQDRLGLSQVGAADHMDVPVQTYRNWLKGRYPIPPVVAVLCGYIERFGVMMKLPA